jgi:hypothetical protein
LATPYLGNTYHLFYKGSLNSTYYKKARKQGRIRLDTSGHGWRVGWNGGPCPNSQNNQNKQIKQKNLNPTSLKKPFSFEEMT